MSINQAEPDVLAQLAPTGKLRAAVNTGNFLLVTGQAANGDPQGVSPDVAAEIARRLNVTLELVCYPDPGLLADAATRGEWDIGNIGAEPQRAQTIAFTEAYCEIECTYLVPAGSSIQTVEQVDQPDVRVSTKSRAAYGLWLENNLKHATLVGSESMEDSFDAFVSQGLEALAGLRPRLLKDIEQLAGARILEGCFSSVKQSVGTPLKNAIGAKWLAAEIEDMKARGFVERSIEKHQVQGLSASKSI